MKTGYAVMVCDHGIPDRAHKVEMLPFVFDGHQSIDNYVARRINPKVTKIMQVVEVQVDDDKELVNCPD